MQNEILMKRDELQEILFLACYAKQQVNNVFTQQTEVTKERLEQLNNFCCFKTNDIVLKID